MKNVSVTLTTTRITAQEGGMAALDATISAELDAETVADAIVILSRELEAGLDIAIAQINDPPEPVSLWQQLVEQRIGQGAQQPNPAAQVVQP